MTNTDTEGPGLGGVLRLTWVSDHLTHVMDQSQTDEPTGTWTGLACPDHGLTPGADVDTTTLQRLAANGDIADLIWEAPADFTAEHGQLCHAAIQAYQVGKRDTGQQLWDQVQALWSQAWSANSRNAHTPADRRPDPFRPGQAAALGNRLLRAPLRPARHPAPAYPQHRHPQFDHRNQLRKRRSSGVAVRVPSGKAA